MEVKGNAPPNEPKIGIRQRQVLKSSNFMVDKATTPVQYIVIGVNICLS